MTADQLRQLLRNSGVSETDLSAVTDAQLMATYQQVLGETSTNTNTTNQANTNKAASTNSTIQTNTNSASSSGTISYDELKNLTPAEIRQFLILSGVDQATLDGVDDATLQSVFLQALQNQVSGS